MIFQLGAHGGNEKCLKNFVAKPGEYKVLERPTGRWENATKLDLMERGLGGVQ